MQQWEQWLAVSRSTVLGDLDVVEAWLAGHGLELERRPELWHCRLRRQTADSPGARRLGLGRRGSRPPLTRLSHSHGGDLHLAEDAHLLPVVQRAAEVISRWKMRRLFGRSPMLKAARRSLQRRRRAFPGPHLRHPDRAHRPRLCAGGRAGGDRLAGGPSRLDRRRRDGRPAALGRARPGPGPKSPR